MTRNELNEMLDPIEKDLWDLLRKHGADRHVPEHAVEEFAIYVALGIKPTWDT